jgi:light-regulated signal transduction histidine kinase (bacteriophytochrome)
MASQSEGLLRGREGAGAADATQAVRECSVHLNADSLHDLASAVNQTCAMTDLILKKYRGKLDDEADALFAFLQKPANRLQNFLAGMRTYMKIVGARGVCGRCDANALLAGARASIQPAFDRSGALLTSDRLPELDCDPSQIVYLFASLMDNSIKFCQEARPEIHVSASSDEGTPVFSVRDNGIGVEARYNERIFGMFKRIDNEAYPGAGVGLAIARQIVELHGGRIWVESKPGSGATFFFTLPRGPT